MTTSPTSRPEQPRPEPTPPRPEPTQPRPEPTPPRPEPVEGLSLTHIGGPTALFEYAGLRILTDPTFDPPGPHPVGDRVLLKLAGPAVSGDQLDPPDLVLLSHDQHPDNLDDAGRKVAATAGLVLSTPLAAQRISGVVGLEPWQSHVDGAVTVTAVPARHGAPGFEKLSGPVTGFVLSADGWPTVYVSGDNASIGIVEQIAERFQIDVALLFCGAARRSGVPEALTLTAADAVLAARAMPTAVIIPVHTEGWLHFTEGPGTLAGAFHAAGLADRLRIPLAGVPLDVAPSRAE